MTFAVVTIETESREQIQLAVPVDMPSRLLAAKIMHDLGKPVRTGETFALYFKTDRGDKSISPTATLAELGINDGQHLRIKRQKLGAAPESPRAHAFLRTPSGEQIPLEANHVIIGRKEPKYQVPLDLDLTRLDPKKAVSRQHASIGRDGNKYYLLDLDSTNGTRVNGEKVVPGKKTPLNSGDSIILGLEVRFTFVTKEAVAEEQRLSQAAKPTDR
jgi:hypothetical protein